MHPTTKTLTVLAVLTNPLTWVVAALALVYCVMYLLVVYIQHELCIPRPLMTIAPTPTECQTCGIALPGDHCQVCGAPHKAATLKPSHEWTTGGTPPATLLLTSAPAAERALANVKKAARKPRQASCAQEPKPKVAKTTRKNTKKTTPKKRKGS